MIYIRFFIIIVLSVVSHSCAVSNTVTWYSVGPESPHCVLRLDNRITDAVRLWKSNIYIEVLIDGSHPTERFYIPDGITNLRLSPGKHTVMHRVVGISGGGHFVFEYPYYSDPVVMNFDALPDKTYTIRFDYAGTMGAYDTTYEGWSEKEAANWAKRSQGYRRELQVFPLSSPDTF